MSRVRCLAGYWENMIRGINYLQIKIDAIRGKFPLNIWHGIYRVYRKRFRYDPYFQILPYKGETASYFS